MAILDPNQSYTFSNYFELRIDALELSQYFGYGFTRKQLTLNQYTGVLDRLDLLRTDILEILPRLVRSNEQAKREALIFPVIRTVAHYADTLLRIEYPIKVTAQLQGTIDYLLSIDNLHQLTVIEAKQGDIDYGFTQLVAELIALDQWEQSPAIEQQPVLIGAVTIGDLWRFGRLDRHTKSIAEDINSYRVPEDLEMLLRILIAVFRVT
ncbi:hypothetical protein HJG54_14780 [Leptolyngbya sp. NK1-12]|uniref:Uncharacterized protein n=1 Tax=Leptolyngbya sp. NK1-12 TaxID=2547451 RepID=A0AA96WMB0_9CYAN|nr:hypothetical protein [Leptolyngbya sp. NK1-12]WNZ23996.1 hypothetical protein HJG54_14780 [Leptolyngbya sp. NK1-12]